MVHRYNSDSNQIHGIGKGLGMIKNVIKSVSTKVDLLYASPEPRDTKGKYDDYLVTYPAPPIQYHVVILSDEHQRHNPKNKNQT